MIIQNDIKDKKTCYFKELDAGDIFSFTYPPRDILMKLPTEGNFLNEDDERITAIYLDTGSGTAEVYHSDLVYPLIGKLVITG